MHNPFQLVTASKLSAKEAVDLWCDDRRIARVNGKESCFLNGHRGTGKSMLFRILQYDCQRLLEPDTEPDFLSVYFPVQDSELMVEELELFQEDSQRSILSESHFALLVLRQLFVVLKSFPSLIPDAKRPAFEAELTASLRIAFEFCTPVAPELNMMFADLLDACLRLFDRERQRLIQYICLRVYERSLFDGPLFLFDTLLLPIAAFLHREVNKALYILIDDADDLPESHTIILNTWIARRNPAIVFKVSTMFGYKTYNTKGRSAIQHPHDFIQYDIATRYVSDPGEDYIKLLSDITYKRLRHVNLDIAPEVFFPEDENQRINLDRLEQNLLTEYSQKYTGRSIRDNVYRHLTSEYIKRVLQPRHAVESYSYSGFKVLATLSSGMVRDYIACAQRMFDRASGSSEESPAFIPPSIQSNVVKEHADDVLEEIANPKHKRCSATVEDWKKLRSFIEGLATVFKSKMLSDDSERRVFSFAFQDEVPHDVQKLLDLAIKEGYLMKGYISRKEGTGRRILYVLSRRLAPAFLLDVSSYSGYLSVTSERVRRLINIGPTRTSTSQNDQLSLFASTEEIVPDNSQTQADPQAWVFISPEEAGQ